MLQKWREDFESLYKLDATGFNEKFKEEKLKESIVVAESDMELNKPITYEEVKKSVDKSKEKKAAGVDNITNELLKNNEIIESLLELFDMCYRTGLIPDSWRESIIHPIPKEKILNDPLKYRGLALQRLHL